MTRVLIVPAAGLGSRLQTDIPKVLFPINGTAMIDYLFRLYAPFVDRFVLVLNPVHAAAVRSHCEKFDLSIEYAIQETPTGMLDAILIPQTRVREILNDEADRVWITWCDQIAVCPQTVQKLALLAEGRDGVVMPTVVKKRPYIHWVRNASGEIDGLLQRREGDAMPERGEGDAGLFSLSRKAYLELLPRFASRAGVGSLTEERNFLPFIVWLSGKESVTTFPVSNEIESVGINDRADVAMVENYLNEKTQTDGYRSGV